MTKKPSSERSIEEAIAEALIKQTGKDWPIELIASALTTLRQSDLTKLTRSVRLLTPAKMVELGYGTSIGALADLRWRGEGIPYIKCGKTIRYSEADAIAYVEANRRTSTADHSVRESTRKAAHAEATA